MFKERRDDVLPFIPKAVGATVVNATAPNAQQISHEWAVSGRNQTRLLTQERGYAPAE